MRAKLVMGIRYFPVLAGNYLYLIAEVGVYVQNRKLKIDEFQSKLLQVRTTRHCRQNDPFNRCVRKHIYYY